MLPNGKNQRGASAWRLLVHTAPLTLALVLNIAGGQVAVRASPASSGDLERAAALVRTRAFDQGAAMLRGLLSVDPANRDAKEMLAFALESTGDLEGERQVRSALAAEFPNDPRTQAEYGRVLERLGEEGEALDAYRRARELSDGAPAPALDAAIERMRGRTALEVATPLAMMSDPDAKASVSKVGAAIPVGSRSHLSILATHYAADGRTNPDAVAASDALTLAFVSRRGGGAQWVLVPQLHVIAPRGGARRDTDLGGAIAGRALLGSSFETEWRAEAEAPWDEAAIAVLHAGRTTSAEAHLYSHSFSRRLLLQAGARRRRLSIRAAESASADRPHVWQSLLVAGADLAVWRKPDTTMRGEMLDEALIAPRTLSSSMTLAFRHYHVTTQTTPEFMSIIALAPRGSVNEASITTALVSPRGHFGLELRGGLARDSARRADTWRAGGAVIWVPKPRTRFALGYEEANELVTGLVGERQVGWLTFHVDL